MNYNLLIDMSKSLKTWCFTLLSLNFLTTKLSLAKLNLQLFKSLTNKTSRQRCATGGN